MIDRKDHGSYPVVRQASERLTRLQSHFAPSNECLWADCPSISLDDKSFILVVASTWGGAEERA